MVGVVENCCCCWELWLSSSLFSLVLSLELFVESTSGRRGILHNRNSLRLHMRLRVCLHYGRGARKLEIKHPLTYWTLLSYSRLDQSLSGDLYNLLGRWSHISITLFLHTLDLDLSENSLVPKYGSWPMWSLDFGVSLSFGPQWRLTLIHCWRQPTSLDVWWTKLMEALRQRHYCPLWMNI